MIVAAERLHVSCVAAEDIQSPYRKLFTKIMGQWDAAHAPTTIFVVHDRDRCVGFLAGAKQDAVTFHVQYSGALPEARGVMVRSYFQAGMAAIHRHYPLLTARVDVTKSHVLCLMLKTGWTPTGMHVARDGTLMLSLRAEGGHG